MGNALDAAKFSASQGLTGVSDPTSSLSAITEGIKTLSDWKTKRDEAKEKLKKNCRELRKRLEKQERNEKANSEAGVTSENEPKACSFLVRSDGFLFGYLYFLCAEFAIR